MIDHAFTQIFNTFAKGGVSPEFQLSLASFFGSGKFTSAVSRGLKACNAKDWQAGIILYVDPAIVENAKLPVKQQRSAWDYIRFLPAAYIIDNPQKIKNAQQRTGIIADVDKKAVDYETYPMVKLCRKLEKSGSLYFIDYALPALQDKPSKHHLPDDFPFPRLKIDFNTEYGEFAVISPNDMHMISVEASLNDSFEKFLENSLTSAKPKKNEDDGENS